MAISHFGTLIFENGQYARHSGSTNWTVRPIPGFGLEVGPPLAQVQIAFSEPVVTPYTVVVSACRSSNTPMLCANSGDFAEGGFVVQLFEPVFTRTLQNGNFSFIVLQSE